MKKLMLPLALALLCFFGSNPLLGQVTTFVQLVHNSPDPALASVDVYVDGVLTEDNFAFREATSFLSVPGGVPVSFALAPDTSTSVSSAIFTFNPTLTPNTYHVVMARGVLDTTQFNSTVNPDISFGLSVLWPAQNMGTGGNVDVAVFHGSPDAPTVDVLANGGTPPLVDSLAFGSFTGGYASVPPAEYILSITPDMDNSTRVASYYADISGLGGGAAVAFASGFLDPTANQNGAAFGVFVALADGTVLELTQTGVAKAQVIHNAADPAADTVDVYVSWVEDSTKIDNFAFRNASAFLELPANYPLTIGIAPATSTNSGQSIATFTPTLMGGETYAVVANGVLDSTTFALNPDNKPTSFNLLVADGIRDTALNAADVDIRVLHGATDAPSVGVNANGGAVIPAAAYGDFSGYLSVPDTEYRIDVTGANDPSTLVAPFYVDITGLAGGATLVFASGFLDPTANQNGEAFGLFAALADGTVVPLTAVGNSRAQVIHNSADPGADTVDIYVNTLADTIFLDNFAFRAATPFVDLPTGYDIDVVVAGKGSTGIGDGIATISAGLMNGETYAIVANGVLDSASFAPNPDNKPTSFGLLVATGIREAAANGSDVDIRVLHGATDAPSVGVNANGGAVIPTASYGDFSGYLSVPDTEYRIDVTGANDPATLVAPFYVDVTGLAGGATLVFASGFLDPGSNQNGEAFGLFAAFPDGSVAPLTAVGNSRAQVIHNSADIAADTVDIYVNMLADTIVLDNFAFRTATPFVDLPTEYEIDIVIAGKNSTGIGDNITTISATLMDGESYHIVANGVLDPSTYAANPDGKDASFALYVANGAQEAAANAGDVDLRVFHGATDAITVDVLANLATPPLVDNIAYGDFQGYLAVPPAVYQLGITPGTDNTNLVAQFKADASGLAGGAGIILATGFLDPTMNQDGAAFGLLLVLADGTAILLDNTTSIEKDLITNNQLLNIYPNPVRDFAQVSFEMEESGAVSFRMIDVQGREVFNQQKEMMPQGLMNLEINTQNLSQGIYHLVVQTEKSISVKKVIVSK